MQKISTIEEFFKKLENDETLATQYKELVERKDNDSIISLLKEHGITDEDLVKAKQKTETMETNGELSDEMLEEVAGGGDLYEVLNGAKQAAVDIIKSLHYLSLYR